ncbi:hypothetical protein EUGRSUZ_L00764 [Eucalyptus grandis]|uniref:Uncharacterized protein n=1 Tax=Eucalyptus grandis TaxID=71139 RepID=A0A058ZVP9_EUCGR|nr:hypothetical protein EUGRSUZ_L00764 [Eucalyptus grandis]
MHSSLISLSQVERFRERIMSRRTASYPNNVTLSMSKVTQFIGKPKKEEEKRIDFTSNLYLVGIIRRKRKGKECMLM